MARDMVAPGVVRTAYGHVLEDGRVQCDLCPRACRMHDGQQGFCFVREARDGSIVLTSYGRASGFCVDPIEKKPLYHFLPGTSVLSFGTAGCNLGCRYCQNWDVSRSRDAHRMSDAASPARIAQAARSLGCASVAFTYNDPVVFHEYAVDTAIACREAGVRTVAVTAGYVCPEPRAEFYRHMDAVNVDLKAFTPGFYRTVCGGDLEPVLDTLRHIRRETATWLEITNLVVPGRNDGDAEQEEMARWIADNLGADTPLHLTAFHPDWRMHEVPATPVETLRRARAIALRCGLRHVYTGNVRDPEGARTDCPSCRGVLVVRDGFDVVAWNLDDAGRCLACGARCAGVFAGPAGRWGGRRMAVRFAG